MRFAERKKKYTWLKELILETASVMELLLVTIMSTLLSSVILFFVMKSYLYPNVLTVIIEEIVKVFPLIIASANIWVGFIIGIVSGLVYGGFKFGIGTSMLLPTSIFMIFFHGFSSSVIGSSISLMKQTSRKRIIVGMVLIYLMIGLRILILYQDVVMEILTKYLFK